MVNNPDIKDKEFLIMSKYKPIQLPRGKSYGSNYYNTYSIKLQRNVVLYSQLEYHNFLTLELNPHIVDYCEQPLEIYMDVDNKPGTTVFDMWVLYDDGREEFQEVKYRKELDIHNEHNSRVIQQIQRQRSWCKLNHFEYMIRTEDEIYKGPCYISNLRYLHGVVLRNNSALLQPHLQQIVHHLKDSKISILEITQRIPLPTDVILQTIAYGIYKGAISADLEHTVFNFDSLIWIT